MEFNAKDNAIMFDFAKGGGTATLVAGKDNVVAFTFPDGAVQGEVDEGPWMGFCPQGTTELIGEMWYRCKTSRAGGFSWPADLIPVVGAYTAIMVPNGGSADAPLGTVELTVSLIPSVAVHTSEEKGDDGSTAVAASVIASDASGNADGKADDEKTDDGSTATTAADSGTSAEIADSGTTTKMEGTFDKETCIKMWGELNDANGGKVTNFEQLVTLWYQGGDRVKGARVCFPGCGCRLALEEYVVTGAVASGGLPFAVQFLSQGWLPQLKERVKVELKILRDHFCAIDETTKKRESRTPRTSSARTHTVHRRTIHTYTYTHSPPPSPF